MKNAKGWNSKKLEALAKEIHKWLVAHEMWTDVAIYYDGKRMASWEPSITEADPSTHFEYVADPHILSMSFEGPLYDVLNYYPALEAEFEKLFEKHGLYYELGDSWNLTCYEI